MTLTNTSRRYGAVAKTFHWIVALGIAAAIPLGLLANDAPFGTPAELADKAMLFSLHKTLGVTLFVVALARIGWAIVQPRPAPLHPERRAETFLASVVHWLLYGSLVLVPLSGWVQHAATQGFAPIWWPFGQDLPFVPKATELAGSSAALHILFQRVLILSILLHVAGALKHALVDRDATLSRMLPGQSGAAAGAARAHRSGMGAPLAALAIWAGAIGVGALLGVFGYEASATRIAALQEADSDWRVTDGTLAITVTQFGREVVGEFTDWSADITFARRDAPGDWGDVTVRIAAGSLTLGSLGDAAGGPDFLDATRFPVATFAADLVRVADGYEARGTLRLKGAVVPVVLPFQLSLEGDAARMEGDVTLDRRDFGIGLPLTDPTQLRFEVVIDIALDALRGTAE